MKRAYFNLIEVFAFLLPAFPDRLVYRLTILGLYCTGHALGFQSSYRRLKYSYA